MEIAVLALQGAFLEHEKMLDMLSVRHFEIRQKKDLERHFDGLILPGGESTVMRKLLLEMEMLAPLKDRIAGGMPVFGTCAGLILLAKEVEQGETGLATMDISVRRNAYGRQLGSFYTEEICGDLGRVPMTFIRAPYITKVYGNAETLAVVNGKIVAARQGKQIVTAFHPELTKDTRLHRYFLDRIRQAAITCT